jgi:hypothetical protein
MPRDEWRGRETHIHTANSVFANSRFTDAIFGLVFFTYEEQVQHVTIL